MIALGKTRRKTRKMRSRIGVGRIGRGGSIDCGPGIVCEKEMYEGECERVLGAP